MDGGLREALMKMLSPDNGKKEAARDGHGPTGTVAPPQETLFGGKKKKNSLKGIQNRWVVSAIEKLIRRKISTKIYFGHTISVMEADESIIATIRGVDKIAISIKKKSSSGRMMHVLEEFFEFVDNYFKDGGYDFSAKGNRLSHDGVLEFFPEISIVIKKDHSEEKIVQRFKTAMAKLDKLVDEGD